jgi:hypothetical protein
MHTISFEQIQCSCLKQVLSCKYTFMFHRTNCLRTVPSVCICTVSNLNSHDICSCYEGTTCRKAHLLSSQLYLLTFPTDTMLLLAIKLKNSYLYENLGMQVFKFLKQCALGPLHMRHCTLSLYVHCPTFFKPSSLRANGPL